MRTLLIVLMVAGVANAETMFTHTNDIGYRWEIGERFDFFRPAAEQTGTEGTLKSVVTGFVGGPVSGLTKGWSVVLEEGQHRGRAGFMGHSFASLLEEGERPRARKSGGAWSSVALSAATPNWELDLGESFITGWRLFRRVGLPPRRKAVVGIVELNRVGTVEIEGRSYPDYQPTRWGIAIPEPSTWALLVVGSFCCLVRKAR